ncbi:MAG TPA: hypothetical protein VGJ24_17020 [Nocardioides sp.]
MTARTGRHCADALERGPGPVTEGVAEKRDAGGDLERHRQVAGAGARVPRRTPGHAVAADLDQALRRALFGDPHDLASVADAVLEGGGGRFRSGLHLAADLPDT